MAYDVAGSLSRVCDPMPFGRTNATFLSFLATVALFVGLILWTNLRHDNSPVASHKPLLMYCAVSIKAPVEEAAKDYERTTGVRIELQYNASQTLLTNAVITQ